MKIIIFVALLFFASIAAAEFPKSSFDFALLPAFCKARASNDKTAEYLAWSNKLGPDFIHVHHYCAGLHTFIRGTKEKSAALKDEKLRAAIGEMNYVVDHSQPGFKLLPKIFYDQGQIYEYLFEHKAAKQAYEQSIKLSPDNAPPYSALSDLFKRENKINEAKAILEEGLKHNKNSKILIKKLNNLSK